MGCCVRIQDVPELIDQEFLDRSGHQGIGTFRVNTWGRVLGATIEILERRRFREYPWFAFIPGSAGVDLPLISIARGVALGTIRRRERRTRCCDAEKQLLKALPKMAKAARSIQLQALLETHLQETEAQVERLNEGLQILGAPARAKPCKGMAGLVEEGEEVMSEGKEKEDAPADLALIGAAQRVEHYEIAAYTTARNLALQLRQPLMVQLLTTSLGEEQNASQLLDQVAQLLMSVAKMPASVE
jgi:Mn-containing catalase